MFNHRLNVSQIRSVFFENKIFVELFFRHLFDQYSKLFRIRPESPKKMFPLFR